MKNTRCTGKGNFLFNAKGNKRAKRCSKCGKVIYEKNKTGLCYFHLSLKHSKVRTDRNTLCPKCKNNLKTKKAKVCRECSYGWTK